MNSSRKVAGIAKKLSKKVNKAQGRRHARKKSRN